MNKGKNVNVEDVEVVEKTIEETVKKVTRKSEKVAEKEVKKVAKKSIKVAEKTEKKVKKANNENVELIDNTIEKDTIKENFDTKLEQIKRISEAIELHTSVKEAVSKNEVDNSYLSYIENSLEDKLFSGAKVDNISSKVLLEVVCPSLTNIENFDAKKLEIESIGSHYEEDENYIDKVCTYGDKFACMFGINEKEQERVIKYEPRKFSRIDMLQAVCEKFEEGKVVQIDQYDEYYVVEDEVSLKIFSERKITDLVKVEETIFDKLKNKLTSLFNNNIFAKKKYLPNIELIYDNNQNRFKDFKTKSKVDAKKRMKALLMRERKVTRNVNM